MRVTHETRPFIASSGRRGKIQAPFEANFTNYISIDTDSAEAVTTTSPACHYSKTF